MTIANTFDRDTVTTTAAKTFPLTAVVSELPDGKSWAVDITTSFTPDAGGGAINKTVARAIIATSNPSKDEVEFTISKLVTFLGNAPNYASGGVTPLLSVAKDSKIVDKDKFLTAGGVARVDPA